LYQNVHVLNEDIHKKKKKEFCVCTVTRYQERKKAVHLTGRWTRCLQREKNRTDANYAHYSYCYI